MSVNYTPRTNTVVILQGEDDAELRALAAFADSLRKKANETKRVELQTLAEEEPKAAAEREAAEAEAALEEFAKEANERGIKVVLRSVGRKKWREIIAAHPPRDDNENDSKVGTNTAEVAESLVPACMASPVFDSDAERDAFLDSLSEAEWGRLGSVAWLLNTHTSADPKAVLG